MILLRRCRVPPLLANLHLSPRHSATTGGSGDSSTSNAKEDIPELRSIAQESARRRATAFDLAGLDVKNPEQVHAAARRVRRRRTMDDVLGIVLDESLKDKDRGINTTAENIAKRTQEKLYEEEHGRKPPSKNDFQVKYMPWGPDFSLHRLEETHVFDGDLWPERSVTPENPVINKHLVETQGVQLDDAAVINNEAMFQPRPGRDPRDEFCDSADELAHWEIQFITFIRDVPLWQRRTLPLLHEHYRSLAHRLIRAEKRFVRCRDAALAPGRVGSAAFKATEDWIERSRKLISETHKSLASMAYDPLKMKRSLIGSYMRFSAEEFERFKDREQQRRNQLISEFNGQKD